MCDPNKTSLRIDWFDGTLIEETRPNTSQNVSQFADEEQPDTQASAQPQQFQKKPIGFKKLLDISMLQPPTLTLEISHKNSFWYLMDSELKGDFIVLIVKILANVYKSLEPGEKSMIVSILKSKFLKSNFLNILKEYLSGLPEVRVVEKRMNSQLWDDAESFYFNVLAICEAIYNFSGKNKEYLNEAVTLLETLETSAIGVREEHTERFRDELFYEIEQLKTKLLSSVQKDSSESSKCQNNSNKDANHFKNLNIFPTKADLLGNNDLNIQPNIINGAYASVDHYLDIQFKLLREDCFGPLREGICKYMENPNKRKHENIRVYPKVRIIRTYVSNNRVGHLVDVAWTDRIHGLTDNKKYAYSKRLMFGSLLLFTCDNFDTILCATVLDSGLDLLSKGYIAVSFHNPVANTIFEQPFLMVESEVFFEPYHRVLKVMQDSMDDLPMRKYIVDVQTQTQPPAYLTTETIYTIPDSKEDVFIPVLDTDQWPTPFDLDASQMEAYKLALTREFAVIQGPPGTGKTFIGVKIASNLLKNLSLEGTPMLIICYTNHALDQFLEGILKVTDNIVRLGSQSKNKTLENYTLNNMRTKIKCRYSYLYSNKRKELEKIFNEMTEVQSEIEKCEKEILSYKSLKSYLKIDGKLIELKSSNEDAMLSWLFADHDNFNDADENVEDWEKFDDLEITTDKLETCFSEQHALKDIESMRSSIKYLKDVTEDPNEARKMEDKFLDKIERVKKRLDCFKKNIISHQYGTEYHTGSMADPYNLKLENRWIVYRSAVASIKTELMAKMNALLEQHNTVSEELEEVATLIDGEVMRTARVVGVTTTTAARRHQLLKRLMSPIVIVEEAAEVLEAHIVASLTNRCQHLILIGDHKQLKPSAAHYKLAKHYNLEISLFERMIRNGIHARTLTTQRRMRPSFVSLIVPAIYATLDSHPYVLGYKDVRGMRDNLWFYDHDVFEDSEGLEDSWSHKNIFEAKWCLALADYMRRNKYTSEEITILATYTGQATLIKELSKKYDSLHNVKVTVVDNYQGEENRIVILSLVRSNRDSKIGFLAAENRICVALSRAKEGFYIFGNMNALQTASAIWRTINKRLSEQNAIGGTISLRCESHGNTVDVSNVEEMNNQDTCILSCKIKTIE